MIKVNLLRDHTASVEVKKQPFSASPSMSTSVYGYVVMAIVVAAAMGYWWISSGNAVRAATAETRRLESDLAAMEDLRRQFVELEQKKQEGQGRIETIERLLQSQSGPVRLLNAVIQAVPQSRDIWLTSLVQTSSGVTVRGETRIPEVLPDFMESLMRSGIFTSVDIEQIERREDVSGFSIICAGGR